MSDRSTKPSILIISDFPNWAYHEIQQFVVDNLKDEYDFYYDFLRFNGKKKSLNPLTRIKNIVDQRKYSRLKENNRYDLVLYLAFYFDEIMNVRWSSDKIIKGIYTDGFPPSNSSYAGDFEGFYKRFLSNADALVCGSEAIADFYRSRFPLVYTANMILDAEMFKRKNIEKDQNKFVIGWTGNPNREFKGYYSHISPAVERLKAKYKDIDFKTRFAGPIEMLPQFYEDVDVVVIASEADAGPSLFGEAALMDIPSISTKIGWPSEVIIDGVNGFFVERTVDDIYTKLEKLYLDRSLLLSMSSRIRDDYQNYFNQETMINRWRTMFNSVLDL